jgi:hypothetical protein
MEMSEKVSPDLLSYSGVMSSIANSNRAADVAKAEGILDLLTDGKNDVIPDNGKCGSPDIILLASTLSDDSLWHPHFCSLFHKP